jgi:sulfite reductase (NADPH) flavoprotein alpha-component
MPDPETATPIIMCGPGTGVAPFRAFVQERRMTGATGPAWLFFGEQHRETDYFYEREWEQALEDGSLTRLTTAFSRDQAHKVYVQHRMLEEAAEFWRWLDNGAIFYVCGDAARMAHDVDSALHQIIESAGGKSAEQAVAYVEQMKSDKRYRRDVY